MILAFWWSIRVGTTPFGLLPNMWWWIWGHNPFWLAKNLHMICGWLPTTWLLAHLLSSHPLATWSGPLVIFGNHYNWASKWSMKIHVRLFSSDVQWRMWPTKTFYLVNRQFTLTVLVWTSRLRRRGFDHVVWLKLATNTIVIYTTIVTICSVGGCTLFVEFHPFRIGWMNLRCGEGASFLVWHSCQVKSCELVCGESLCEMKIACFGNKFWVSIPFLTLLDSLVVEWEITWLIVCIWRENLSFCKVLILFFLYRGMLLMYDLLCFGVVCYW